MKTLKVHGSKGISRIFIGERLQNLQKYTDSRQVVIITDRNVRNHYSKDLPSCYIIEIGTGETMKNLDTVQRIYLDLLRLGADRSFFIVGIGGGVVSDITGFVASTYLRGLRFGFVSSTLLSQVDAGVGGKNGVNLRGYKNLVGTFNQPEFVICDTDLLKTLPEKEVRCGLAEVVKHACIGDACLFSYLEAHYKKALALDRDVMEKIIHDSVVIKSSIVNRDERESGERMKLNFGHTLGHAIEKTTGIPHGEAVGFGMLVASRLSFKRGWLSKHEVTRIEALLKKLNLPTRLKVDGNLVIEAMTKDKKRRSESLNFVFLHGIGEAFVEQIPIKELGAGINEIIRL
ncbi:MAG: 3-dehydroquinate synthase [Deltaproteobacteria bacterium]|nr:3-dehydroquinate synthase [Deltaproteobacteria bacterium]MBW1979467.1 3-dehydroquinate synthase [Deltaproteobacteria bacterium]MBW2046622.1 3-dehydroquinate synthase [Deltaproteobacteria bacterium]MBW2300726.1 3-dehydroquinate synthase [Deltaproteobacteria bacterium]